MEQLLVVVGVAGLLFVAASGLAAVLVVRGARRRYRAARARLAAWRGPEDRRAGLLHASGSVASATIGSPGWWTAQSHRHRMWRAVTSAEQAVAVARRTGVPVGDLPALAGRLHGAATGVDAVLRAGGRQGALRHQDRVDCDRIVAAASDLRSAALSSLRWDSHADTEAIASAVQLEVAALTAGVRAAHR